MEPRNARDFNNSKHGRGDWNTTILTYKKGPLRAAADYCSAKRRGVTDLADVVRRPHFVLDAGAGNGAYSIWYLARTPACVLCVDIAVPALRRITPAHRQSGVGGRVCPVCADLAALPFKQNVFDAIFSIDTLGHVSDVNATLDEFVRTASPAARLFLHSECADYTVRWPDKALIARLGADTPAERDGHAHLRMSRDLFVLYSRRFRLLSFINPAGYAGWCLGYPEKYRDAFDKAGWKGLRFVAGVLAACKRLPVVGTAMRVINATTNHLEVFFGFSGGGSCFAHLRKPD